MTDSCVYCNWDGYTFTMCKPCKEREEAFVEKAYAELIAYEREIDDHNSALVRSVSRRAPQQFVILMDYCNITGKIEQVSSPKGSRQHETVGPFKNIHVDQYSVGMEGDSFAGDIYAKTSKLGWIKIPYSC